MNMGEEKVTWKGAKAVAYETIDLLLRSLTLEIQPLLTLEAMNLQESRGSLAMMNWSNQGI